LKYYNECEFYKPLAIYRMLFSSIWHLARDKYRNDDDKPTYSPNLLSFRFILFPYKFNWTIESLNFNDSHINEAD